MLSVIFDMDGTLLDTQRICVTAWEYAGRNQGVSGMGKYVQYACGMNKEGCDRYVCENFPELDYKRFRKEELEYVKKNTVVRYKKGAIEMLKFLKQNGIKTAVASGTAKQKIIKNFEIVGGMEYFDALVGGDEVQNCKPAPDIFLCAAQKLGTAPEDCVVIEDSLNGVKAAEAAGMKCILIPDISELKPEEKLSLLAETKDFIEAIEIIKNTYNI